MGRGSRLTASVLLAVLTVIGTGPGAVPAVGADTAPAWTGLTACSEPALSAYRCGTLTVPLDRTETQGPKLALDVLVAGSDDATNTLLVLTGGPGQPGPALAPKVLPGFTGLGDDYRIVMLDQRGTGDHALDCPALQEERGDTDLAIPTREAVRACADSLGDAREHYRTTDTVGDLEDLRTALGVDRWAVDGVSYGTYTGQRYAAAHPGRVTALVLDSVVPVTGVDAPLADIFPEFARVMRAVCATPGRDCPGDPAADLDVVLDREPERGPDLLNVITAVGYIDPDQLFDLPERLHAAAGGDDGPLDEAVGFVHETFAGPADQYSQGVQAATLCADSTFPWGGADSPEGSRDVRADTAVARLDPEELFPFNRATARGNGEMRLCEYWPRADDQPVPPTDLQVDVPTLILVGERDLGTPLPWARAVHRRIPGSRLIVVPHAGHSIQASGRYPAVNATVADFLLSRPT